MTDDGPEDQPDLRYSDHEQRDVRVSRDLSGGGHLARGDRTRMSRLDFRARGKPRNHGERDDVFVERDAASTAAPGPARVQPAPAEPAHPEPVVPPGAASVAATLRHRVGRFFGL